LTTEWKVLGICFLNADFIRLLGSGLDNFTALDQQGNYKVCRVAYDFLE
jgi:hypothetical protein